MVFQYKARDFKNAQGDLKKGTIEADSPSDAVAQLQRSGLIVTHLSSENGVTHVALEKQMAASAPKTPGYKEEKRSRKFKNDDLCLFFEQFSVLMDAGVDIIKALNILSMQVESEALYLAITDIQNQVSSGISLSKAMRKYPKIFTTFIVNLVEIGETGGILADVAQKIALHLEKGESVKRKLKSAMIYPGVIIAISIVAIAVFFLKIIPTFEGIFKSFNVKLPGLTMMVINISHTMRAYIIWEILAVSFIVLGVKMLLATPEYRYKFDKQILKVPVLGDLLFKTSIVNFTMALSTLLSNGVNIVKALDMTKDSVNNVFLKDTIRRIKERVKGGGTVSKEIEAVGVFPPLLVQMLAVGEESGKLVEMLEKVEEFYERRVTNAVAAFSKIIEPVILLIVGTIVGVLVIAMFMPMFKLTQVGASGGM